LAATLLWAPSEGHAQGFDSEIRIDQFQPASAGSPFTRAEGPHDKFEEGIAYGFRVTADYGMDPLRTAVVGGEPNVPGETSDKSPVKHALLVHVGGAISPLHWLNLEISMPFAPFETGDDDISVNQQPMSAGTGGVGDLRIGAHARPFSSKEFDLSLGARFWAPTGTRAAYMAGPDGDFRVELVASAAGEVGDLVYGCTLGLAPMWFVGRDGDRLAASCGALYKVVPMVMLGVEPHFAAFTYAQRTAASDVTPGLGSVDFALQFEPMGSAVFRIGDFSIGLAGGAGLGSAPGTAAARGVLTLGYAARGERVIVDEGTKDRDLDGVADGYDACPDEAGPESNRGCPKERDRDGDGIQDDKDACPEAPGARYDDPKATGCPDRDNDHVADPIDPCPLEPGQDSGGCPKYARYKKGRFTVTPPIRFKRKSTALSNEGRVALVEIIRTMRANPKIKQVSIGIGTKGASTKLTDKRASTVLAIFSDQNFDTSRFEVVLENKRAAGQVSVRVVR